ncbi:unnamed protein product [Vicia faba]|uniref:Uncharacterized protein n=1 Tax=Vicia faba TaxID=3906 RepID=A0AAV1AJV4_VICFA|nr:unnamed protein product [Vicia faba]
MTTTAVNFFICESSSFISLIKRIQGDSPSTHVEGGSSKWALLLKGASRRLLLLYFGFLVWFTYLVHGASLVSMVTTGKDDMLRSSGVSREWDELKEKDGSIQFSINFSCSDTEGEKRWKKAYEDMEEACPRFKVDQKALQHKDNDWAKYLKGLWEDLVVAR